MSEAYRNAGVNLELGDELSSMLYEASKQTWQNRAGKFGEPTSDQDNFAGLRGLSLQPLMDVPSPEGITLHMGDDGVGTKVEVAQRVGNHSTIAYDLLAMVCDDAAIRGYEPAAITTTLDVHKLSDEMRPQMTELAFGYIAAANAAGVALVNGEVAELGDLVGGYGEGLKYNWSATIIAAGHKERLLDGMAVRPGDSLVGFAEQGFRSNGLSLVRKTLKREYGEEWHTHRPSDYSDTLGRLVLRPSTIYSPVLVKATGGYDLRQEPQSDIHAAAHITGGGIPGKLGRMLRASGWGADISEVLEPSPFMSDTQLLAGIDDEEAYKVWNMGTGMIVATPEPETVILLATEAGVAAREIGHITRKPGITIRSAGREVGRTLTYAAE